MGASACWLLINVSLPSYLNAWSLDPAVSIPELFDNPRAEGIIADRYDEPAFVVRYGVSDLQEALLPYGVPAATTFTVVNLLGVLLAGALLARVMPRASSRASRELALAAILLWLPVLFAFTAYTAAYDDFVQLPLLLLAWWAAPVLCAAVAAAVLVRETSAVFAGYLFLVALRRRGRGFFLAGAIVAGVAAGLLILRAHPAAAENAAFAADRLSLAAGWNFNGWSDGVEAVLLLLAVVALPATVLLAANRTAGREVAPEVLLLLIGNTALVALAAIIHETRLFLLGMLPLLASLGHPDVQAAMLRFIRGHSPWTWALVAAGSAGVAFGLYHPSAGRVGVVYQTYMWPYLTILLALVIGALRHGESASLMRFGAGAAGEGTAVS